MSDVPSNLIPTRITQLPVAPVADENSLMMIVYQGNNYQIRVGDLLSVAGVPTSTQVIAGTGMTGGGALTGNVTLSIANGGVGSVQLAASGVTSGVYGDATNIPVFTVDSTGRVTAATTIPATISGYVPTSTQIIAGNGLSGGGALSGNVTLSASYSGTAPQAGFQTGSVGASNNLARSDHKHPAVDLSSDDQVDNILGLNNGGTAKSLVPAAGAIVWSGADGLYIGPVGVAGQVLVSGGAGAPTWGNTLLIVDQPANVVYAGPAAGAAAPTTFRALVNADLPASGVSANTYGSTTAIPVLTVNSKGVITSATTASITGALVYQGAWNALTNTPTLTSSVGVSGYYYVVSVAGTTNLNGITDWQIGDWAIFNGTVWQKIDQTNTVSSVNGQTGAVSIAYADLAGAIPTWNQNTTGTASNVTGVVAVANGGTGRTVGNYSIYANEIHVGKDGNDTTGDGTLINPVLTITKALTLVGAGRNTVVVHPGSYSESPTVSSANTTIETTELTGANTQISGTLTLSAAARISGLKITNLTITGSGNTYISNCTVDTQVVKSGTNYVEIINTELQCVSGVQITGAGTVSIVGNKCWAVAVSNASANVLIKDCFQVLAPSVTAGTLQFDGSAIFAASPASNAVTSSAGSFITLANCFVLNSAGTNVERVSLAGFYSILNLVYDKTNSTFAGTNLNAIDYFSVINADSLVLTNDLPIAQGGTGQSTASAAFNALSPITTTGDLILGNGANSATRLAIGANGYLLTSNGTTASWVAAPATGVTSFAAGTTGLTPATATTGAVTLAGTLALANGGSGQTTAQSAMNAFAGAVTSGSYLRGNGTNVVMNTIQVADVPTLNQNTTGTAAGLSATLAITSGGTGQTTAAAAITALTGTQTSAYYLRSNGTNATLSALSAADLTGTVAIASGGTGQTTASAAFNALSPITTTGDLILGNGTNSATRLAIGANGYLLSSNGTTASWQPAPAGGVTTFSGGTTGLTPASATTGAITLAGTLALANGGSGQTTAQAAMNAFAGAVTSGSYLRGNGTNVVMNTIQVADVPTLNQNTTGTAANVTGIVAAVNGGTGQSSYAVGDLVYASTTTALSKLADVATGNALISGGVGVAPSYGKIGLTTHVSGTLPIANGGTNSTATATAGGAAYGTGTAYAFTAAGTAGQVLTSAGASAPTWSGISGGTF